jgi:hypothetical protein
MTSCSLIMWPLIGLMQRKMCFNEVWGKARRQLIECHSMCILNVESILCNIISYQTIYGYNRIKKCMQPVRQKCRAGCISIITAGAMLFAAFLVKFSSLYKNMQSYFSTKLFKLKLSKCTTFHLAL